MKKQEIGRSMIEMLGVLAIVGVLSIGGVAGYSYAINKYRANEIVHEMSVINVDFATALMIKNSEGITLELESPYDQQRLKFGDYMFNWACGDEIPEKTCEPGETVYFMALGIEGNKGLCEQLVEMIPSMQYYSDHIIYTGDTGNEFVESEECSENNVIEIAFQVEAGIGGSTLEPEPTQPVCPNNAPHWNQDTEECEACPNGKYWGTRTNSDGSYGAKGCWDCHYSKDTPYWNGHLCLSCPQNTVLSYVDDNGFRLYSCVSTICKAGSMWARRDQNAYSSLSLEEGCISCENLGMIWDESRGTCLPAQSCAEGEVWSDGTCSRCSDVGAGTMPYWNGYFCDMCPEGTWYSYRCCNCNDSSTPFFNTKTGQCEACPEGTSFDSWNCSCN